MKKLKITSELIEMFEILKAGLSNNYTIESSGNFIFENNIVYCFDGDTFISYPFSDLPPGSINGNKFYELIKSLKDDKLTIENKDENLILRNRRKKISFNSLEAVKSPVILPEKWDLIPSDDFLKSLDLAYFSVRKDMIKPSLACAYVDKLGYIYSCDNFRVSKIKFGKRIKQDFLILGSKIKDVIKFKPVKYSISEQWILFQNEVGGIFGHRIIADEFPVSIKSFFDDMHKLYTVELPKDALTEVLKRANIFHDEMKENKTISITIHDNKLICKNKSSIGSIEETIKVDFDIEEKIAFEINPLFLIEIMEICKSLVLLGNEEDQITKALFQSDGFEHIISLI